MKELHPAVKAIIQQGENFLIIKQEFNNTVVWDFPGGKVGLGKTLMTR